MVLARLSTPWHLEVADLLIDNGGIVYKPPFRPKEQNTEEENKE